MLLDTKTTTPRRVTCREDSGCTRRRRSGCAHLACMCGSLQMHVETCRTELTEEHAPAHPHDTTKSQLGGELQAPSADLLCGICASRMCVAATTIRAGMQCVCGASTRVWRSWRQGTEVWASHFNHRSIPLRVRAPHVQCGLKDTAELVCRSVQFSTCAICQIQMRRHLLRQERRYIRHIAACR